MIRDVPLVSYFYPLYRYTIQGNRRAGVNHTGLAIQCVPASGFLLLVTGEFGDLFENMTDLAGRSFYSFPLGSYPDETIRRKCLTQNSLKRTAAFVPAI